VSEIVKRCLVLIGLAAFSAGAGCSAGDVSAESQPQTLAEVDLERYAGLWYEIAKIPNRFQRKCAGGTTAEYTLRGDGRIGVVNRCRRADGSMMEAEGVARVVDAATRSKLQVSFVSLFGLQLFWGDYWIIGLGTDYEYAVIGHPARRYGWVLARSASLSDEQWAEVRAILGEQGYAPEDFEMTTHTEAVSPGTAGR